MADFVWGRPVQGGETIPGDLIEALLYKVRADGTRRLASNGPGRSAGFLSTGIIVQHDRTVPPEAAGFIPTKVASGLFFSTELPALEFDVGRWVDFANADGEALLVDYPVTPGESFYKFRDILSHHAHRFVVEHNPANLPLHQHRRPTHRTPGPRVEQPGTACGPGNVSSLVRPNIGHLWERIHRFVLMPAEEAGWKVERDALKVFIEEHLCAVCEGAGLSYRLMADHPREEWKGWLDAELRFTVDRNLTASPMSGKLVTPEVVRADMNNFRNALAFHGAGLPDNDYGGNGRAVVSGSEAAPTSKTLPYPEDDTLERMALLAYWSRQYRLFDGSGLTGLAQPVWRNWCWMNCAGVLEGWRNQVVRGGLTTNKGLTITKFGAMAQVMRATQQPYLTLMRNRFIRSPWDIPFTIIDNNQAFRTVPGPDIYFVPRTGGSAEVETSQRPGAHDRQNHRRHHHAAFVVALHLHTAQPGRCLLQTLPPELARETAVGSERADHDPG